MRQYKIQKVTDLEQILILQRTAEMENERYSRSGDYSVTDLINPPRICHLKNRHKNEIMPSLEGTISAMIGTALHEYYEKYLMMWADKHDYEGYTLEGQTKHKFEVPIIGSTCPRTLSGRYDILEGDKMYDLKTAKVWKLIFDPKLVDYHEQQNIYRWLLWKVKGIEVNELNIVAVYKDWMESGPLKDPRNYPAKQMMEYQLTMWDYKDTEELIRERLQVLVNTEGLSDKALPLCTRDERWERHQGGEQIHYGILKNREAKRATKVVRGGTLDEAMVIARGMKGMTERSVIEVRYAKPKRCVKYCDVNQFCNFYQDWCQKNDKDKYNEYIKFKM